MLTVFVNINCVGHNLHGGHDSVTLIFTMAYGIHVRSGQPLM